MASQRFFYNVLLLLMSQIEITTDACVERWVDAIAMTDDLCQTLPGVLVMMGRRLEQTTSVLLTD